MNLNFDFFMSIRSNTNFVGLYSVCKPNLKEGFDPTKVGVGARSGSQMAMSLKT